jgi:hypothetical protein
MSGNAQQLLTDVLEQQKAERNPSISAEDFFEIFTSEQVLKDLDLSYEEIESGIVDGEHDGGVDAVYCFVNDDLVYDDFDQAKYKKQVAIDLHIFQAKSASGFSESDINKIISTTNHLLKLGADDSLFTQYNDSVKSAFSRFRKAYRLLASKFPEVNVSVHYSCKKADDKIHENLYAKCGELEGSLKVLLPEAIVKVNLLTPSALLALARKTKKQTFELKFKHDLSAENGYVILCELSDFDLFIKAGTNNLRLDLFESNVRDFQGSTEVNSEIQSTLLNESSVDFWAMNNGVTILAGRESIAGGKLTLENPQIVNGLQTSTQISRYFSEPRPIDRRLVLVKVIASEDDETRDKIIKATNSQNSIQAATLRATDKIQRDVEQALKAVGLFYDRRKNYYKNQGKPADAIISIGLMAQSVMSAILQRPDQARARPSTLIKETSEYNKVFSENFSIGLYCVCGALIKKIDRIMRDDGALSPRDRNNIRFYVLYWVVASWVRKVKPDADSVSKIEIAALKDDYIIKIIPSVLASYNSLGGTDQVAKGTKLRDLIQEQLGQSFRHPVLE